MFQKLSMTDQSSCSGAALCHHHNRQQQHKALLTEYSLQCRFPLPPWHQLHNTSFYLVDRKSSKQQAAPAMLSVLCHTEARSRRQSAFSGSHAIAQSRSCRAASNCPCCRCASAFLTKSSAYSPLQTSGCSSASRSEYRLMP